MKPILLNLIFWYYGAIDGVLRDSRKDGMSALIRYIAINTVSKDASPLSSKNIMWHSSSHFRTDRRRYMNLLYLMSYMGWSCATLSNTNRGLQALSVQFRFAFSKPSSSQTRFLNRPVAAPAEVAHFCGYKKNIFRPICVLKGGY